MKFFALIFAIPLILFACIFHYGYRIFLYLIAWLRLAFNVPDRIEGDFDYSDSLSLATTKEASNWINQHPNNSIAGFSNKKSAREIRKLLRKGASNVYVLEVEALSNGAEYSRSILIELPEDDHRSRQRLFEWEYLRAATMGFQGVLDQGQKHLFTYWT